MYRVCTDLPSLFHFTVRGYASSSINVIFPIAINTNAIPTFPKLSNPSFLFLSSPPSPSTNRNKRGRRGGERGKYNNTRRDSTQMRTNRKPETVPRRCFENARRTLGAWKSSRRFFQANLRKGGETLFSGGVAIALIILIHGKRNFQRFTTATPTRFWEWFRARHRFPLVFERN